MSDITEVQGILAQVASVEAEEAVPTPAFLLRDLDNEQVIDGGEPAHSPSSSVVGQNGSSDHESESVGVVGTGAVAGDFPVISEQDLAMLNTTGADLIYPGSWPSPGGSSVGGGCGEAGGVPGSSRSEGSSAASNSEIIEVAHSMLELGNVVEQVGRGDVGLQRPGIHIGQRGPLAGCYFPPGYVSQPYNACKRV